MLSGVPNFAWTIGYTNASWTLKADLIAQYVCRLLAHMDLRGYAVVTNTLNHPSISCNPHLAGEATMMTKEYFIEHYGVPFFTVSTGGSGGAYTSLQVADAFPGLFDGVSINATFPDALSIGVAGLHAHLLFHYWSDLMPNTLTAAQKVAISGYQSVQAALDAFGRVLHI